MHAEGASLCAQQFHQVKRFPFMPRDGSVSDCRNVRFGIHPPRSLKSFRGFSYLATCRLFPPPSPPPQKGSGLFLFGDMQTLPTSPPRPLKSVRGYSYLATCRTSPPLSLKIGHIEFILPKDAKCSETYATIISRLKKYIVQQNFHFKFLGLKNFLDN